MEGGGNELRVCLYSGSECVEKTHKNRRQQQQPQRMRIELVMQFLMGNMQKMV